MPVCAGNYGAPGGFWYDPWSQDDPIMVSLPHAHHLLPIAHCSLPTVLCPSIIAHPPLSIAHYPNVLTPKVLTVAIVAASKSPCFLANCLLQLHNATAAYSLAAHGQCCVLFGARQH